MKGTALSSFNPIQLATALLGLVFTGFLWSFTYHQMETIRLETLDASAAEQTNLVTIVTENLRQITERARLIANLTVLGSAPSASQLAALDVLLASDPVFNRISIYATSGGLIYASSPGAGQHLEADVLQLLDNHQDRFGSGTPLLRPEPAHTESYFVPQWRLPFVVSVRNPREPGKDRVLLIELDLGYLLSLYQRMDLGRSGLIQIYDAGGQQRVRANSAGIIIGGGEFPQPPEAQGSDPLRFRQQISGENDPYQSVLMPVPELGLSFVLRRSEAEILKPYQAIKQRYLIVLMLTSVMILSVVAWLLWMLQRRQRTLSALHLAHDDNSRLIERLEREHQRSTHAAATDHLTGLLNRRSFVEQAQQVLDDLGAPALIAVLFIDLDRFKSINDSLGHRTGDLLLKAVAGRIETLVTSSDRAARFGGDEFVLMLIGRLGRSDLESVVIRLRDGLSAPYQLEDKRVHVSPSIGIAWTDGRERDLETLIRHADIAMYSAKRAGRGQYRYFQRSESEHRTEEFELEQGLQAALKHNEFELVYQPIVDLVSERLLGLEALVRWRHPQRGVLPAERFIPVAERAGLMSELGIEILRIAMRQMSRWRQAGVDCMPVSVDVSPQQLQHNGFSECVLELLDNLSIDGAELRLEVSESAILGTNTQVYDQLEQLSQAGIGITLDHFGRGYAGFAQLQRLPFSTVKLDRKLVGEIRRSDEDPAILSATIALARKLSLEVVAEGVETLEQLACLQRLGCNRGQGALLYPPLVCDEITPLLQSQIDRRDT